MKHKAKDIQSTQNTLMFAGVMDEAEMGDLNCTYQLLIGCLVLKFDVD